MRLLIVDDDSDLTKLLALRVAKISRAIECILAESVTEARAAIEKGSFDVCLVDLALPSKAGAHDETIDKGEALVREIAADFPGTFIILYSGFSENRITDPLYEQLNARRPNILGELEASMFINRPKDHPSRAIEDISRIFEKRKALAEAVQFEDFLVEVELDRSFIQIIRAFGKSRGAATIRLRELRSGKSGAVVYAVTYFDASGNLMLQTVVKLDHWSRVKDEERKFEAFVAGMLKIGSYAPLLNREAFLSGQIAGMFYQEIVPPLGDLSSQWSATVDESAALVSSLRTIERGWTDIATGEASSVGDLRKEMISDSALAKIYGMLRFDISAIDAIGFRARFCLQHGDLHAGNILLTDNLKPYFLDFASIERLPAVFDALTLELAYIFNNPSRSPGAWPSEDVIRNWHKAELYFEQCPAKNMLIAARAWAVEAAAGFPPTVLYAVVYCYALRQLQYKDTDKVLALALAETMVDLLTKS